MRQIPKKNYIYALLILVITVPLTFLLINTFKNNKEDYKIKIIEIKENELNNYLTETTETVIYYSSNEFEELNKQVDKYVSKSEFKENTVYLDSSLVSENFEKTFIQKYNAKNMKQPCLLLIENGKVTHSITIDAKKDIKRFFTIAEVIND